MRYLAYRLRPQLLPTQLPAWTERKSFEAPALKYGKQPDVLQLFNEAFVWEHDEDLCERVSCHITFLRKILECHA